MLFLKTLEWAFGAFLLVFVVWQIAAPLLMGRAPFPMFRESSAVQPTTKKKEKSSCKK